MALDRVKTKAKAEQLLRTNKIQEAIREYQKLVEDSPHDISSLNQLGNLQLRVGNKDAAVPLFFKVAELYTKQGFAVKAMASLKIVTREQPDNIQAHKMLASLCEQQGFVKEARLALEKVAELTAKTGDVEEAIRVDQKLLEIEPENFKVRVHLGDLFMKVGKKPEGVQNYLKAGQSLVQQGLLKESALIFARTLEHDARAMGSIDGVVRNLLAHKEAAKALQFVQTLQEQVKDGDVREILGLLKGDVLVEEQKAREAYQVYAEVLAKKPTYGAALSRMVRLLLAQKAIGDAAAFLEKASHATEDPAELAPVEALYEEVLRFAPNHLGILKGMARLYRLGQKSQHLKGILEKVAEAAVQAGDLNTARGTLKELLALDPANLGWGSKLQDVEVKLGIVEAPAPPPPKPPPPPAPKPPAPAPPKPPPPPPPPAAPPAKEVPAPPPGPAEEEFSIDVDIEVEDTGEAQIEVNFEDVHMGGADATMARSQPKAPPPTSAPAPSPPRAPALRAVPPPDAEQAEAIREQLTEAEVFLKYGLAEKAIVELQSVVKKVPDHIQAHQKLIAIFKEQRKKDKAVRQILKLAAIFREHGDQDMCESLLEEAREVDPNHKAIQEFVEGVPAEAAPAAPAGGDISIPFLEAVKPPKAAPPAPPPASKAPVPPSAAEFDLDRLAGGPSTPKAAAGTPSGEQAPPLEIALEIEGEESPESAEAGEEIRLSFEELDLGEPAEVVSKLEEAEFYVSQELFGEAQKTLDALRVLIPGDERVTDLQSRLDAAAGPKVPPPPEVSPAEEPLIIHEAEAAKEDTGPAEVLTEAEAQPEVPEPPVEVIEDAAAAALPEEPARKTKTKMKVTIQDLLGEEPAAAEEAPPASGEGEYYDLAAELGAALDGLQTEGESLFEEEEVKAPEEMSFEEVFEEFKKGVQSKVGEEDAATHYNLGIAYKEMELVDEAISEFQVAARSPEFFVECCAMLGICFRQKGMHELAERWYRKGIEAPGFSEDSYIGLKYDLAETLEEQGKDDEAQALYKEVYAASASYRDVKKKIKK